MEGVEWAWPQLYTIKKPELRGASETITNKSGAIEMNRFCWSLKCLKNFFSLDFRAQHL
jgi:hypothetical protein